MGIKVGDKIDVIGFGRWNKARIGSRGYRGIEVLRGTVVRLWPHKVSVLVGTLTFIFRLSDGHEINYDGRRVSGFRMAELMKGNHEINVDLARRDNDCSPGATERPADQRRSEDC